VAATVLRSVRVLEADPELARRIPPARVYEARRRLVSPLRTLSCGFCDVPEDSEPMHLGYLVLDGLLARDVVLAGHVSTELLGEGDVVQGWATPNEETLIHCRVYWHVLEPVRLAVLDSEFARALVHWPQVLAVILERANRRALHMSIHHALLQLSPVETRLLVLFWHLAERWGRVTPKGVLLPLALTHQVMGQLVGCQRASVTTALKAVAASGLVERSASGGWLLHGEPPDELSHLSWGSHEARPASTLA
jgi:CRP/FNR family transcriptional regulator, cyclic AMP receptor protein